MKRGNEYENMQKRQAKMISDKTGRMNSIFHNTYRGYENIWRTYTNLWIYYVEGCNFLWIY